MANPRFGLGKTLTKGGYLGLGEAEGFNWILTPWNEICALLFIKYLAYFSSGPGPSSESKENPMEISPINGLKFLGQMQI